MKKNQLHGELWKVLRKMMRIMRLSLFLIIISTAMAFSANSYSQNAKLTMDLNNVTVKEVIKAIENQSEFLFFYQEKQVDLNRQITVNVTDQDVETILNQLFAGTDNIYVINDRQIVIGKAPRKELEKQILSLKGNVKPIMEQSQKKNLKGKVTDSKGESIPGTTVIVKGTTIGTITDFDGNFTLDVPPDAKVLAISFIGFKAQEIPISNKTSFSIILEEETVGVEEVVVVGYGQQKKMTVTGSISSVSSEQLVQSPVANISNSLAGRATGVIAVQRSGEPGQDQAEIRIRGVGTFSGSQDPLILVDGIETANYNNIDPNEIANISILKDASSTAVYGVRGANGVILINTKRGKVGRPKISYSSNIAATTITDYRERMGAVDYTSLYNEALKYDSYISGVYTQFFTDEEIELYRNQTDPIFNPDVDWMKMMYKDWSIQKQHNLNISGGTDLVKYFVSLGSFEQEAQFNNTNLQKDFFDQQTVFSRYNFRSNFDFNVTKRLTVKFNVSAKVENKRGINSDDVTSQVRGISLANPIGTPALVDGNFVTIPSGKAFSVNPFEGLYSGHRKTYRNYIEGSFRLDYDLGFVTKGLTAHGMISFENFNMYYVQYFKPREQYTAVKNEQNETILLSSYEDGTFSTNTGSGKRRQTYAEMGVNYARTFGNHSVSAMVLYNQQKKFNPSYEFMIPIGYQGLVGRVTYDYKNRYLVEYNAGYNGTENFAPGKRFGYFPAYSLGWVLSEESFFPKNDIISFVKIRGSYGEVGNDQIGGKRFLYLPSAYTYSSGTKVPNVAYYWGEVGSTASAYGGAWEGKLGNPNVTWERARKSNAGIELTLFKDKIRIIADVFKEKRDNILMTPKTAPILNGLSDYLPAVNMGKVDNHGFDGEISYNGKIRTFNYWIKANGTYAKNTIIFQDEIPNPYPYQMSTGQAIGQYYGYASTGLYNRWEDVYDAYRPRYTDQNNLIQPGVVKLKDINGDGVIDGYDAVPIGYPFFPEINYGISLGGEYKGFDFSFLFQGASNVTFIGSDKHIFGWNNWSSTNEYLKNSWSLERYEQGLPIYFPHLNVAGGPSAINRFGSSYFAEDASYVRLKNAEIGYRFDGLLFMKKLGVDNARIYVNGSNLWTWAYGGMGKRYPGVDPEDRPLVGSGGQPVNTEPYPRMSVVNLGINLNF